MSEKQSTSHPENIQEDQVHVQVGKKQKHTGPILDLLTSKFAHEGNLKTISDRPHEEEEKLTLNVVINTLTSLKEENKTSTPSAVKIAPKQSITTSNTKFNESSNMRISPVNYKVIKQEKTTMIEKFEAQKLEKVDHRVGKIKSYNDNINYYKNFSNDETLLVPRIAEKSTNIREDNINNTGNTIKSNNILSKKNSNSNNKNEFMNEGGDQTPPRFPTIPGEDRLINLQKIISYNEEDENEADGNFNNDSGVDSDQEHKKSNLQSEAPPQKVAPQNTIPLKTNTENTYLSSNIQNNKSVKIRPKFLEQEAASKNKEYDELSEAGTINKIHTVNIKLAPSHNRYSSHTNSSNLTNLNININFQQIVPNEKYTNSSKLMRAHQGGKINIKSVPKSKADGKEFNDYISPRGRYTEIEREEIKQEMADYCDDVDGLNSPGSKHTPDPNMSSPGRNSNTSPRKNWKKISNFFKTMKSLHRYETKNIVDESGFDYDLKDYKDRLFGNTIKCREILNPDESRDKSLFDSKLIELIQQNVEREEKKINYKEEIYRIIVDGDTTAVTKIDKLFRSDPEYYLRDENDPNFKFNTPLSNGKTLLYIACQEGKIDIVRYLLDKKINAFVKSKLDDKSGESALGVAARWNYANIVTLLLEKVQYKKDQILEVLDMGGLTKRIRKTLKRYYKAHFKSKKFICCG